MNTLGHQFMLFLWGSFFWSSLLGSLSIKTDWGNVVGFCPFIMNMCVCHSFFWEITSVTQPPSSIIHFPLAAMGNGQTWVDAVSWHQLLRKFHPLLSALKQAKESKDPSSSLKVELMSLAAAGGSCLLSLVWLCSLNTLLLGRREVRTLEGIGGTF